jgi:hypothetical protein
VEILLRHTFVVVVEVVVEVVVSGSDTVVSVAGMLDIISAGVVSTGISIHLT